MNPLRIVTRLPSFQGEPVLPCFAGFWFLAVVLATRSLASRALTVHGFRIACG